MRPVPMYTHTSIYRVVMVIIETIIESRTMLTTGLPYSGHTSGPTTYLLLRMEGLIRAVMFHFELMAALIWQGQDGATAFVVIR